MIFKWQRKKLVDSLLALRGKERTVATWDALVKDTGKSRLAFCHDNDIPYESFSRWINGVQEPNEASIQMVMAAFVKEGVYPCQTA